MNRIDSIINEQLLRESKDTGLMPDFFVKSDNRYVAPKYKVLESKHDGDYFSNSCRTPWRYSMDILFDNVNVTKQINILNQWIKKKTNNIPRNIRSGYYVANGISGEAFGIPNNLAFVAPFLVSSLTEEGNDQWTIDIWKTIIETPLENCNFYGNTLKLMAMIIATGNWFTPSSTERILETQYRF